MRRALLASALVSVLALSACNQKAATAEGADLILNGGPILTMEGDQPAYVEAVVVDDGDAPRYIGRIGLAGPDGERLLVDWRTPAAEPSAT